MSKNASEYEPTLNFGLMLQGTQKTGKTTLALQFEKCHVIDADNNLSGPIRWLKENMPQKLDFTYDIVNKTDDGLIVPDEERWVRVIQLINGRPKGTKTLIVDSLSSISDYLVAHIIASKKGTGKDEKKMTISDWIPFRSMISKFITDCRNLGMIFIMTSHEERVKDELTGSVFTRTNMPSKLADNIGAFFSDVWRTEVTEGAGGKSNYIVRANQTPSLPGLGNSLGLPNTFTFTWNEFAAILNKYKQFPKTETGVTPANVTQ